MAPDLVPASVLSAPENARRRVAFVVAAATGAAALAGLWVRFEDGLVFRLVLAVTSAFFGWLTMHGAFGAKDASRAAMRALAMSIALGALSTVGPCLILGARDQAGVMFFYIPFGAIFGAFTGFVYGIVLAIVAAATWNQVASRTHDGADRAVRIASVWAILPAAFVALVVFGHDLQVELVEWASEKERAAHAVAAPLGLLALGIVVVAALFSFVAASRRLSLRTKWISKVVSGVDPRWAVREIGPRDDVGSLPHLRRGVTVLEHRHEHAIYRSNATGEAVAII